VPATLLCRACSQALRPIPRNNGQSLSADLRLIGAAVTYGQLSGTPSPDTPSRSARKREAASFLRRPLIIWSPAHPFFTPSLTGVLNPHRALCARKGQISGGS